MPIKIEYKHNLEKKIRAFGVLKVSSLKEARRSGLSSTGFFITNETRTYIENQGNNSWPKAHPMTQIWKKNKNGVWKKRDKYLGAYYNLGKFVRYVIDSLALKEEIGFGFFSGKQSQNFNFKLQRIAEEAQKKNSVLVTSKMRSKIGAQKSKKSDVIGKDFFPIKGTTSVLERAARPIFVPIFKKIVGPSGVIFDKKFSIAIKKRYRKL